MEGVTDPPRSVHDRHTASMTTHKISPNSGRKRATPPALMRSTPTSSHGTKMASIFKNAADSREGFETPSRTFTPEGNKFRMPLSYARTRPFGYKVAHDPRTSGVENSPGPKINPSISATAPVSANTTYDPALPYPLPVKRLPPKNVSGINEVQETKHRLRPLPPAMSHLDRDTVRIQYPPWRKPQPREAQSSASSFVSDCHSSHGVPLVIPVPEQGYERREEIDTWLTQVVTPLTSGLSEVVSREPDFTPEPRKRTNLNSTMPPGPLALQAARIRGLLSKETKPIEPLPRLSNNKENAPPNPYARSKSRPLLPLSSPLILSPASVKKSPPRLHSTALSPSPRSPLNLPPRRMTKTVTSNHPAFAVPSAPSTPFRIHEDDCAAETMPPLSPNVELHRKGRSPKKERCASYWDDDLWIGIGDEPDGAFGSEGEDEPRKGKKVLGVSGRSEELTREKPFVDQADGAPFGFRVRVGNESRRGMDLGSGTERKDNWTGYF